MIKNCCDAIIELLSLIHKNYIGIGTFPVTVSLLPIFGKIFGIILLNSLFKFIQENELLKV